MRHAVLPFVLIVATLFCACADLSAAKPQDAPAPSSATGDSGALTLLRQQGVAAFQANDCPKANKMFQRVIASGPPDIVIYNLYGHCWLRLKDYTAAIDAFQHALQIQPDEWHNVSSLMRAYTLAEKTRESDELQKHIAELEREGKLPDNFNYVFETFQVGDQQVEVSKFLKLSGFYGERYWFNAYDNKGTLVFRVALESNQLEQPLWAKEHKKLAAAGGRQFSLDGYSAGSHYTYGFYDGEPDYALVRNDVEKVLRGEKHPITQSTVDNSH